jgi:hypothetical protein
MKILMVGDVVGKPGRRVLLDSLPGLYDRHNPELTIVNAENAAGGFGVTASVLDELLGNPHIDVLTSGNHIWDKLEALQLIDGQPRLLRPHNYPEGTPGQGWVVVKASNGVKVGILNIMGTVFMHPVLDCPFRCADQVLSNKTEELDVVLVDFHAEATSEKMAMGWYLDGRVSVVVGTHTHVATADERILPDGTAYISDLGMTGCYNSILGMNKEKVLNRFLRRIPERFEPAIGPAMLCGAIIDIDEISGQSRSIDRVTITETEARVS